MGINEEEMLVETEGMNHSTGRKKTKVLKVVFLIYHVIVSLVLLAAVVLLLTPDAKIKLLSTPLGKYITRITITEENYQNIFDTEFKEQEIVQNTDIDTIKLDKYLNIALFGLDSREQELSASNSDTIMVVSINTESKEVKLVSVYRDSYQKIYNGRQPFYSKINAAYASGGPEGVINTLNQNFDLDIKDYVTVNFNGIATIIDLLGGVDVNLTEEEQMYVNGYLTETRMITGMDADDIYQYGQKIHLNGLQATAYCRIRYTALYMEDGTVYNNDFGRTARQRIVLTQLVEKAKSAGLSQVLSLCDEVFKSENDIFKTSLTYDEVMDLIPVLLDFSMDSTTGYPFTYNADVKMDEVSCVVAKGHAYNVCKLHEYLFGEDDYQPSSMVLDIDKKLKKLTGVYTELTEEDEEQNLSEYETYLDSGNRKNKNTGENDNEQSE